MEKRWRTIALKFLPEFSTEAKMGGTQGSKSRKTEGSDHMQSGDQGWAQEYIQDVPKDREKR